MVTLHPAKPIRQGFTYRKQYKAQTPMLQPVPINYWPGYMKKTKQTNKYTTPGKTMKEVSATYPVMPNHR